MSKASRQRYRERMISKRRAEREARQKRWAELAGTGKNKKAKRSTLRKNVSMTKHMHIGGSCHNTGCLRCSGIARLALYKMRLATHGEYEALKVAAKYGIVVASN